MLLVFRRGEREADFARRYIFEPQYGGRDRDCMRDNPGACRYNGSGRATALFLDFLARNHPGTLARANAALRAHAFDNETFWKDATGKTAAELEELWRRELGETPQLNVRSARARAKKW